MNVALYIRVSTQEQALHGLSLADQQASLERWAKENHCNVVGLYADEGISARKSASKRPALQRLLDDVRAGKVEMVVFTKLDRWFRSVGDYYKVQEILEKHKVNWRTIYEDYDTTTASGRLKINIMLSVAQDEADRTSERIKIINDGKRQRGEALTGQAPFGYKVENRKLVKDPETEKAVEAFFTAYKRTASVIAAKDSVLAETGMEIPYQTAYKMLKNTAYIGRYWGADDMCPPYISREDYDYIQVVRKKWVRKPVGVVYMFSGLVICGECGHRMHGQPNRNKGVSPNYHCQEHYLHNGCPNNRCPGEKKIEQFLLDSLDSHFKAYKLNAIRAWDESQGKSCKREIAALRGKLGRLKDLYVNELITMDEFRQDRARMEAEIEKLETQEKQLEKPDFSQVEKLLSAGWREAYSELGREDRRTFWRMLIGEIRVYQDRRIEYTFRL